MTSGERHELPLAWRARAQLDVLHDQIAAIDAWNTTRRAREMAAEAALAGARSREMRLDVSRRLDVVRRQHQALVERTEQQLREGEKLLQGAGPPRAVVVHRNPWFKGKVAQGLEQAGVRVVAVLDNGADGVGAAVAEQPDLLFVEDRLPMLHGDDVLRQVLQFAPTTIGAAQASSDDGISTLLDAGARVAYPRRVPPQEVARGLFELLQA